MCLEFGLNGLAGGDVRWRGFWRFLGRCPSRGHRKTKEHVENGSKPFSRPPLKHGRWTRENFAPSRNPKNVNPKRGYTFGPNLQQFDDFFSLSP